MYKTITKKAEIMKKNLFEVMKNEKEIIVFDTETTGLNKDVDDIIQLSAMKFEIKHGELEQKDVIDVYINPNYPISPKITEITGLTDEFLEDKPFEDEVFREVIFPFFGEQPVIAAYNSAFDIGFMKKMYERYGFEFEPKYDLDVLVYARDIVDKKKTGNHKLITMARHYEIDDNIEFHNALGDITVTAKLLVIFYEHYREMPDIKKVDAVKLIKPYVKTCRYWERYNLRRVYIMTDVGKFYYDAATDTWHIDKGNLYEEKDIDFEALVERSFKRVGVKDAYEFAREARQKWKESKDGTR